ncbi:phage tail protein [Algibacter miyuki]|uniref:Phage tail protein n=1 Tax=Algibacter miyuki TaxID=1306933 RepID=A0ABV5H4Q0_9FLAO|nr:tail fiber protein [Algibacter miyuki]MDN3667621.1 tail fiber protein [Algibacter miyuki]MDN3667633.1 tail fiber protein [Algibacter miyuki]
MEPFLGQIQAFGCNFAPLGWAKCEGQLLAISQNEALFSLLGTIYGGDGRTTFALPDLRGRSMVNEGNGPGLSPIRLGEKGGSENITLTAQNIPAHSHAVNIPVNIAGGEESSPAGAHIANHANAFSEDTSPGQSLAPFNTANSGGNTSFSNRDPFLGMNICIALKGIFPSRS